MINKYMENEKRNNPNFPNSTRGLTKTFLNSRDINKNNKNTLDDKLKINSQFNRISEVLELNNANDNSTHNNHINNINNSNSKNSNRKNANKTNLNFRTNYDNAKNFLVSHKVIFQPYRLYEDSKFSSKSYGSIISYGVNTFQGTIRNYNEDRVSIILNVIKPPSRKHEEWPKVSFFGIFDGHGGTKCSDFLKENLHHYV